MSGAESVARLFVDGESIELILDAADFASLRKAVRLAKATRQRDLDRVVDAHLARDPDATLDELCAVARRRRSEVSSARKRVREGQEVGSDGSSPVGADSGPGYGMVEAGGSS